MVPNKPLQTGSATIYNSIMIGLALAIGVGIKSKLIKSNINKLQTTFKL